jgi:ATP-dependent Lon protease
LEDKIIDLVDVIAEPDPALQKEKSEPRIAARVAEPPKEMGPSDLETLVRKEVERLIRSKVEKTVEKMVREVLIQEIEKAIAREIESLKRK